MSEDRDPVPYVILAIILFWLAIVLLFSGCTHITREKTTVIERQILLKETTIIQGQQGAMWTDRYEI
jgi:hypothetical protein